MECTQTSLVNLMSYVPENKVAAYFPIAKNHVMSEIMFDLFEHMYETSPCQYTGYTSNIQALSNLERSLKVHCPILKTHAILDHGLILKQGQSSQLVFRQEGSVLVAQSIYIKFIAMDILISYLKKECKWLCSICCFIIRL